MTTVMIANKPIVSGSFFLLCCLLLEVLCLPDMRWFMCKSSGIVYLSVSRNSILCGLADSWDGVAYGSGDYAFASDRGLHCDALELGCGFADDFGVLAFVRLF